jgi:hypothetical protein
MFANIKLIKKPIRRKDFRLPTGEPVPTDTRFSLFKRWSFVANFKYIRIYRAKELVKSGSLIVRRRVELRAELHHRFRKDGKVCSKGWHLASIMQSNITDAVQCQSFYKKIENRLQVIETKMNKKLSDKETAAIWAKIEAVVPKPSV